MNRFVLCILVSCCAISARAQIPNGNFETLIPPCPAGIATQTLNAVASWTYIPNHTGTPDYFNACATNPQAGVPNNLLGTQSARSGNGYGGFMARIFITGCSFEKDYTEYLSVRLTQPLLAGKCYNVKMHVVLSKLSQYSSSSIGMLFSQTPLTGTGSFEVLDPTTQGLPAAQIIEPNPVTDINNWTEISGTFQASGGEEYLTIGVFDKTVANINFFLEDDSREFCESYYYVEDVSITVLPEFSCNTPYDDDCCQQYKEYENTTNLPDKTHMYDYVSAEDNTIVLNGDDVTFKAGNFVNLLPGFEVEHGATFHAAVKECNQYTNPNPQIELLSPLPVLVDDGLCYDVAGATHYEFKVIDRWETQAASGSGSIQTTPVCIWSSSGSVSDGTYWIEITFSNCGDDELHIDFYPVIKGVSSNKGEVNQPAEPQPGLPEPTEIHVYPNPVDQVLYINGVHKGQIVVLTDLSGRVIMTKPFFGDEDNGANITLNMAKLPAGVYIVRIEESTQVTSYQVLKK